MLSSVYPLHSLLFPFRLAGVDSYGNIARRFVFSFRFLFFLNNKAQHLWFKESKTKNELISHSLFALLNIRGRRKYIATFFCICSVASRQYQAGRSGLVLLLLHVAVYVLCSFRIQFNPGPAKD